MRNSIASRQIAALNAQKKAQQETNIEKALEQAVAMPETLLDAIESVMQYAANCELKLDFFKLVSPQLDYIASRLGITPNEALMLSVSINVGANCHITLRDLAEFFDCPRVRILKYAKHLDSLVEHKYLRHSLIAGKDKAYVLKYQVEEAIKNDEPYIPSALSGLDDEQLFEEIHSLVKYCRQHLMDFSTFMEEMDMLLDANLHLQFPSKLKKLPLMRGDKALLIVACDQLVNRGNSLIQPDDYECLFDTRTTYIRVHRSMADHTNALITDGWIEAEDNDGFASVDLFSVTNKTRTELLSSVGITEVKTEVTKSKDLTQPSAITAKQLFYNPSEAQQITRLESLLQPDAFNNICSRLAEQGMRKGFACLFYGAPGTGKTETVLQLARKTGRALMQVNISEIRDKWVGETEKNIKAIFERYRTLLKSEPLAPILFFNEADALLTKRSQSAERSVDKMENAMQNIILQEIESLEGILIATTNLTSNLDPAFERRFIYKIEFSAPSLEAKQAIWRSMIPSLKDGEAKTLATTYNFSGGQIENIARKHTIEQILSGEEPTMAAIRKLCDAECMSEVKPRRAIGF